MKKLLLAFVVALWGTFVCNAAEIDGKWKTSVKGQNGDMELVFIFKADGATLTGSIVTPMGEMPISNGKIDGKEFSFDIDMNGNPMPHKGTLEGDVIKMKVVGGPGGPDGGAPNGGNGPGGDPNGGGPGNMTLKRVVQ